MLSQTGPTLSFGDGYTQVNAECDHGAKLHNGAKYSEWTEKDGKLH